MPEQLVSTIGTFEHDKLFAGGISQVVTGSVTLKSGKSYVRGTILGLIDAENKATIVDSTKEDGSQRPYAILADDVDATTEDRKANVYFTGEFNEAALFVSETDTVSRYKRVLREVGIFLKNTIEA